LSVNKLKLDLKLIYSLEKNILSENPSHKPDAE
jgi:hypothetical protein